MKKNKPEGLLLIFLLGVLFLSACGSAAKELPTETAVARVTVAATATEAESEQPTQEPTLAEPTEAPTLAPIVEAAAVDESAACIDCHADQERLIDTASSEVADAPENEGEG